MFEIEIILNFIVGCILCLWVYSDAKDRGMSAGGWAFIVFLFGILGAIFYLLARPNQYKSRAKPKDTDEQIDWYTDKGYILNIETGKWEKPKKVKKDE